MNKRKNLWKQLLAVILTLAILVTSADLQLLAAPVDSTGETIEEEVINDDIDEEPDIIEETEEESRILSEVESEREESSKTFLMSDGTFMVAEYGTPIHYEDENQEWQEMDYSLIGVRWKSDTLR